MRVGSHNRISASACGTQICISSIRLPEKRRVGTGFEDGRPMKFMTTQRVAPDILLKRRQLAVSNMHFPVVETRDMIQQSGHIVSAPVSVNQSSSKHPITAALAIDDSPARGCLSKSG